MGYSRAGFAVYGVDINPRPHYPFPFHQGDALVVMRRLLIGEAVPFTHKDGTVEWLTLADFAAIGASPPCQAYSITANAHEADHPELVEPTRDLLIQIGLPYVIENVVGAPLIDPLMLCGTEFGLRALDEDGAVLQLRRHRLFESNVWLMGAGGCQHDPSIHTAGVYTGSRHNRPAQRDDPNRRGGYAPRGKVAGRLLGIDWMNTWEQAQAIPPAYTEWIGHQLIDALVPTNHANGSTP